MQISNGDPEAFGVSVSKDLRTPVGTMAGFSQLLESESGPSMDLLRFTRLGRQDLSCEMVDPARLAREALEDLQPQRAGRDLDVLVQQMPMIWANRALFYHVYLNLLSNALRFTSRSTDPRIVVCSSLEPDGAWVYSVQDNGAGFDMQYADRLFGVGQRLHSWDEHKGNGVGLALVKAIVERHGGKVWADAKVGAGATFSFSLARPPSEWP